MVNHKTQIEPSKNPAFMEGTQHTQHFEQYPRIFSKNKKLKNVKKIKYKKIYIKA